MQPSPSFDGPLLVRNERGRYVLATADQILAAARWAIDQKMQRGARFLSSAAVKEYLRAKLAGLEHEIFAVLFFDTQQQLIEYMEMFRGTLDSTSVHPREVVKEALRLNASAVVLAHNHPSGNSAPSTEDKLLTRQLKTALNLVDVRVLDHVIVAGCNTTSFAEFRLL